MYNAKFQNYGFHSHYKLWFSLAITGGYSDMYFLGMDGGVGNGFIWLALWASCVLLGLL
jgi:hypothetical protein